MFNRILVPLDGSTLAESVVPYVEELGWAFDAEICVAHVCEARDTKYQQVHQLYIAGVADKIASETKPVNPRTTVKAVLLEGEPASVIIEYAPKNEISLIIMASHGRSGIMAWALGSIATKVLQRVIVPILLIRANVAAPKPGEEIFGKILAPLDGSKAGEAALPYVRELGDKLEAKVTLLQVVPSAQKVRNVGGLDYVPSIDPVGLRAGKARLYLEEVSKQLTGTRATVKSEIKIGDPAQEIINFADEIEASLIAMSSHGHSGITQWTLGSVANKVLHSGNKPVLLVRSRKGHSGGA